MDIRNINKDTIFFNYEWINNKYTLCEYTLKNSYNPGNTSITLINHMTDKFHIVSNEKLNKEFSDNLKDAAMKGVQYLNKQIKDNIERNMDYSNRIKEILAEHVTTWIV